MILRAISIVSCSLLLCCCASSSSFREREPYPQPRLKSLTPVAALGYQIYLQDQAASLATDLAVAAGLKKTPSTGWLALIADDGWLVRFVGPCGSKSCAFIDVERRGSGDPTVLTRKMGEELSADQARMWTARQTAIGSNFRRCTETYNTAVIADQIHGNPVWRVYLLAASSKPEDVVLAGHHKVTTSNDGEKILSEEPLSMDCLINQARDDTVAFVVTHILHPEPIETHVFTSLTYRIYLGVVTKTETYAVKGTEIRKLSSR